MSSIFYNQEEDFDVADDLADVGRSSLLKGFASPKQSDALGNLDFSSGAGAFHNNHLDWDTQLPFQSLLSRGPSISCEPTILKKVRTDALAVASTTQSDNSQLLNASTSFQAQVVSHSRNEEESSSAHQTSSISESFALKKNRREKKEEKKVTISDKKKVVQLAESSKASRKRTNDESTMDYQFQKLTNKKREYLEEAIVDRNGEYQYDQDPLEYKKARKRMQNRESAVRSRMRKKFHQDDLEVRIQELEKIQKDLSEQNAGLTAQNALLQKQLTYFEDIFAKSSLLGFDPASASVNKSDLVEFQKTLLKKINQRLSPVEEQDSSMDEIFPTAARNILDDSQSTESGQARHLTEERLESLRLVRSRSNSSSFSNTGYLFLAVVFCMMCCSSLLITPGSVMKFASETQGFSKILAAPQQQYIGQRKLMSATASSAKTTSHSSLASSLDEDMSEVEQPEPEIGAVQMMKMLLTGQYTYLTYMLLSTTCFFFWLTPNFNKIRSMFKFSEASSRRARRQTRSQTAALLRQQ